ncbi:MAG TPA: DUF5615 family PIN-like protein [Kiritimatiellia bacterium]|nr:DUF5615 family PIN-like protein [Kiritimatiellia bacterium]HMO98783.1 DUF5615 family PIN-like protein [Kiritimatiellia bacterium]HMP91089.1 DUF5615 family PIN-like protein [Kiritimatiellia bacterium]
MKFLVDAQLPPALAAWLVQHGHEASAVRDLGLRDASDSAIWALAERGQWIIVTKDEDFADRVMQSPQGPSVIWLRIGNCVNRVLFARLEPLLPDILRELSAGQRLVEVSE